MTIDNDEIIRRGHDALSLLADERLIFFLNDFEEDIKTASFSKHSTDVGEHTSVYHAIRTLSKFRSRLQSYANKAEKLLRQPVEENLNPYDDE